MAGKGRLIFCTGGCRSGKSSHALSLAEKAGPAKSFVATLVPHDPEMLDRVRKHRAERGEQWRVIEVGLAEALSLSRAVAAIEADVVVLDCLSTWVSACQETLRKSGRDMTVAETEEIIVKEFTATVKALESLDCLVVLVSAETGLGLVPETALGRAFRDILGKVNQVAASKADEAYFLVSGLPLRLK